MITNPQKYQNLNLLLLLISLQTFLSLIPPSNLQMIDKNDRLLGNCFQDDSGEFCVPEMKRNNKRDTLMFVTPWNSGGYANSIEFAPKIDYVSPAWFKLSPSPSPSNTGFII